MSHTHPTVGSAWQGCMKYDGCLEIAPHVKDCNKFLLCFGAHAIFERWKMQCHMSESTGCRTTDGGHVASHTGMSGYSIMSTAGFVRLKLVIIVPPIVSYTRERTNRLTNLGVNQAFDVVLAVVAVTAAATDLAFTLSTTSPTSTTPYSTRHRPYQKPIQHTLFPGCFAMMIAQQMVVNGSGRSTMECSYHFGHAHV